MLLQQLSGSAKKWLRQLADSNSWNNRWIFAAIALWLTLVITCAAKTIIKPERNSVFPIYTFTVCNWFAGRDIYVEMPGYDWWRYSPAAAIFFTPFNWLGDAWGGAMWRVFSATILAWGIATWTRHAIPKRLSIERIGLLWIMLWPFALQNLNNGQTNTIIAGLLLLATANMARGRLWWAAFAYVGAALFKPYVFAIAMLAALVVPKIWSRLAVALVVGVVVPFLFQTPEYVASQYGAWLHHFLNNERAVTELRNAYRDFSLLFRVYLTPLTPSVTHTISAIAGIIFAVLVWRGRNHGTIQKQLSHAFALGCCWATLFGPATESCTYIFLAPALAASVVTHPGDSGRWMRISYAMFAAIVCAGFFPQPWKVQILGVHPVAALIFLFTLLVRRAAESSQRSAAPTATISAEAQS